MAALRARAQRELATLPDRLKVLDTCAEPYRVEIALALRALAVRLDEQSTEPLMV